MSKKQKYLVIATILVLCAISYLTIDFEAVDEWNAEWDGNMATRGASAPMKPYQYRLAFSPLIAMASIVYAGVVFLGVYDEEN